MRLLIAGAGAVGSWVGGELAAGGAEVVLVARGAQALALASSGLRVERSGHAPFSIEPQVLESLAEAEAAGPFDLVLVTVKSYATAGLVEELSALPGAASILSLQNGLGNEQVLERGLPGHVVHAGSLTLACQLVAPGQVRVGAKGGLGLAGEGPLLAELQARLEARDIPVQRFDDPAELKWSKLLLNMLGAATCAALGWPPARVFEQRRLFALELAAWREALAVMAARGIRPRNLPGYPVALYARLVRGLPEAWLFRLMAPRLARGRGERLPGPAADLAAGRPETEIAWLNGAVARAGAEAGCPTPVNRRLDRLVAEIAAGRIAPARFAGRPEALLDWVAHDPA